MMPKTRYIAAYIAILSIVDLFFISIDNTKNHVATLICIEWHSENMFNMSIIDYPNSKDNVGDYLYLKESENGNFKFKVDAHQLDLRFTIFHNFLSMFKKNQKLAGLWLAGEVVNHVGIYGSKAAEGVSAFQRRSCQ